MKFVSEVCYEASKKLEADSPLVKQKAALKLLPDPIDEDWDLCETNLMLYSGNLAACTCCRIILRRASIMPHYCNFHPEHYDPMHSLDYYALSASSIGARTLSKTAAKQSNYRDIIKGLHYYNTHLPYYPHKTSKEAFAEYNMSRQLVGA